MVAAMEQALSIKESARDEIVSLEARQEQLLELVGELLRTNEELRQKVAVLEDSAYAQGQNGLGESIRDPD
jgi:hypothetical protein